MKKTIITLIALAGVASAADTTISPTSYTWNTTGYSQISSTSTTDGTITKGTYTPNQGDYDGTITLNVLTASSYYENGTNVLYNWINDAIAGKSVFVIEGDMCIGDNTTDVTLLHVGRASMGFSFGVKDGQLVVTNENIDSGTIITLGSLPVNTETNKYMTDYYVSIGKNGLIQYSIGDTTLQTANTKFTTNWTTGIAPDVIPSGSSAADYALDQNYKYSIGNKAPGWGSHNALSATFMTTGIKVSTVSVPEPTTATLSLLALAGLAARRRRSSR